MKKVPKCTKNTKNNMICNPIIIFYKNFKKVQMYQKCKKVAETLKYTKNESNLQKKKYQNVLKVPKMK